MVFFFFNDTAPPEIYPLSRPDALPILRTTLRSAAGWTSRSAGTSRERRRPRAYLSSSLVASSRQAMPRARHQAARSEEHTSELQSRQYLVCRLLLENSTIRLTSLSFCR